MKSTKILLIHFTVIMTLMFTGFAFAADAISLPASEPQTIYYTTSGAMPTAPATVTTTAVAVKSNAPYADYYVAEGTKITPPTTVSSTDTALGASERISLSPSAGKGTKYIKPQKLKFHESKREFEKHIKEKHGKRFSVMSFGINQSEHGLKGSLFIVENKNSGTLILGPDCTEGERARRISAIKEFIVNNAELVGFTENEELREQGLYRNYCGSLYFNRYINDYKLQGSVYHLGFEPQWNFSLGVEMTPITPEMYAATQLEALTPEDVAKIVYKDLNSSLASGKTDVLPKLKLRKYLKDSEPYVFWEVQGEYIYEINAITGEILFKQLNVKY